MVTQSYLVKRMLTKRQQALAKRQQALANSPVFTRIIAIRHEAKLQSIIAREQLYPGGKGGGGASSDYGQSFATLAALPFVWPVIAGIGATAGAGSAASIAMGTSAVGRIGSFGLLGGGALGGGLLAILFGGKPQQTLTQTPEQDATQETDAEQKSKQDQEQDLDYDPNQLGGNPYIYGSPGATLNYSLVQPSTVTYYPSQMAEQTPSQTVTPTQTPTQATEGGQTQIDSSMIMIIIAIVGVIAVMFLMKPKGNKKSWMKN